MMEIINRKHDAIGTVNKRSNVFPYINFNTDKRIILSVAAVEKFELSDKMYLHVVNDDERWFIYFNRDPDGFKLQSRRDKLNKRAELYIYNQGLITLFMKRNNRINFPIKYPLSATGSRQDGSRLIEICIDQEFE